MKRAIFIILFPILQINFIIAQTLLDIYKNGPVKLVPVKNYGEKNNWESLFDLYYDTLNNHTGEREQYKKIIIAPDGSVFMSHSNRHEIWKFGLDGNYVRSFRTKVDRSNKSPLLSFIEPVVDNKYFFTYDVRDQLKFYDLNGKHFKTIKIGYMTENFQPLSDGEILLAREVFWKPGDPGHKDTTYKYRHLIVNLNIYSEKEKIIFEFFTNIYNKYYPSNTFPVYLIPATGQKAYLPNYISFRKPVFTLLKDGEFIFSNRETGEVKVFDKTGKVKHNFKLDIYPIIITEKDAQENFEMVKRKFFENVERIKKSTTISETPKRQTIYKLERALENVDRLKDLNNYFPHLPYFANIILDDEGNLLVFEFTRKEDAVSNIFNVIAYNNNGKKLARNSFVCDDFDLNFSKNTFVISKGYVYAVAKLKNYNGMPLRLVKFKMTN